MKTVFEAANSLEAHMILDLLAQAGIDGQILGEALQGGFGDLPVAGLVRVVVSDTDFIAARIIVEDWNNTAPENPPKSATIRSQATHSSIGASHVVVFAVGLLIGAAATGSYFLERPSSQGVDYDKDGRLDEFWYYSGNRIQRTETDLNLDGKIDMVTEYDIDGVVQASRTDIDFDGKFDAKSTFENGTVLKTDYDTDHDGRSEIVDKFQAGILKQRDFFVATSTMIKKRQYFTGIGIVRSEVDTDNDGIFDTLVKYDDLEEIISTEPLPKNRND